jgi:hypothetical protein
MGSAALTHAEDGGILEDLATAVREGKANLTFRYRYEYVDQVPFTKEANASTLKSRLTYTTADLKGFSFGLEADYVSVIGSERYDSTENGKTQYPVVADPEGFDLNQAYVRYMNDVFKGTLGRQRINHGSQRFVGGVGWRQNEQTYDAVRGEVEAGPFQFDYTYVDNVNRIFGPNDGAQPANWRSDSHLIRGVFNINDKHSLTAAVYLMDFKNDNGPGNSNSTYGLDYKGALGPVSLAASYARQSDYGKSPLRYDADYYLVEAKVQVKPVGITLGYEVLGSDNGVGFKTPLATLHKFQGWADKFLGTPGNGVRDGYAGLNASFGAVSLGAVYHDFSADSGGADYGQELDLVATWKVNDRLNQQLKSAFYEADEFATDTDKVWLTAQVKL